MQHLFVYGSLQPTGKLFPQVQLLAEMREIDLNPRKATTEGMLFALREGYPGLIISDIRNDNVTIQGYVLDIKGDPALIQMLNTIERYSIWAQFNYYDPQRMTATIDGHDLCCWCYTLNPLVIHNLHGTPNEPQLIPNGVWQHNHNYFATDAPKHEEQNSEKHAEEREGNATGTN